jgi:hypothetical protein
MILKILIHAALLNLGTLARILLLQLLVKLFLNESLTFFIAKDGLFLLLVVKQRVELLYGSPLVLLLDLRIRLSLGALRPGPPAVSVKSLLFYGFISGTSALG